MKGIDIVVGGSVGHMSAFMAQTGCLVVCGDAGDALGDSIYEARLYVRGSVRASARTTWRRSAASRARRASRSSARRRRDRCRSGGVPALRVRRGSSTTSRSTTLAPTDGNGPAFSPQTPRVLTLPAADPGTCASRTSSTRTAIARSSVPRARGSTTSAASVRSGASHTSTTCLPRRHLRYPLEGTERKCGTDVVLGTRFATKPLELKIQSRSPV